MVNILKKILRPFSTVVFTFVEILISLLLSAVLLPLVTIFVLTNEIVRLFVAGFLRIKFSSSVKLIPDGADCTWSYKKPGNGRMSLVITYYRNELEVENYRELFYSRIINYETSKGFKPFTKLTYIFTKYCGYFCWKKDENFNIKNHVRYYPGSENKIVSESEFLEIILPELCIDMENEIPQWEEVIIPKFQHDICDIETKNDSPEGNTVCIRVFRYHHGYMDGASTLIMFQECMSGEKEFPYVVDPLAPLKVAAWKKIMYNISCVLLGATTIIKSLYFARTLTNRFATNNFSGQRIFSYSSPIDVNTLKTIRAKTKQSLPSIIATIIGGALRNLEKRFPSIKEEFRNIPDETVLGLVGAVIPYPNSHPRNRFTVVHYPVNISELPRLQRLQLASEEMGRFPGFVIHHMMSNAALPIIFTNVPLTTRRVKYWDNEVVDCTGFPPLLLNTGLGILTVRYNDHMRICGVTDQACLSETELKYFLSEVVNEIGLMTEECSQINSNQLERPPQIVSHDNMLTKKKMHAIHIETL